MAYSTAILIKFAHILYQVKQAALHALDHHNQTAAAISEIRSISMIFDVRFKEVFEQRLF